MTAVKAGDRVRVHYTGRLEDGTIFDTSVNREPLEFTVGEGRIIPGFEKAVIGMSPGQTKSEKIPADEAYGPHHEELLIDVSRSMLPEGMQVQEGQILELEHSDGYVSMATVVAVKEDSITLDMNHPLAGKDLYFQIELVEIVSSAATTEG